MEMEYMELMKDIALKRSQLDTLVKMLLNGAKLSYDKKELRIGNEDTIMDYIHAIRGDLYDNKLSELQERERDENGK